MNIDEALFEEIKAAQEDGQSAKETAKDLDIPLGYIHAVYSAKDWEQWEVTHETDSGKEEISKSALQKQDSLLQIPAIGNQFITDIAVVAEKMADRTKKIDYKKPELTTSDVTDLKLHLAYARTYGDMVRLRLFIRQALINEHPD